MECPKCGLLCSNSAKRCDCGFGFDGSYQAHRQPQLPNTREVVVTDIKMPFTSMVLFMVKWSLASIPAIIILGGIGMLVAVFFGGTVATLLR